MSDSKPSPETVRETIRQGYGKIAQENASRPHSKPSCCGSSPLDSERLAKELGYTSDELDPLPEEANMVSPVGSKGTTWGRNWSLLVVANPPPRFLLIV